MHTLRFPHPRPRAPLFAAPPSHFGSQLNRAHLYSPIATGTSLEATADPLVPRPPTKHCEVTLLTNQAFADFNNKTFTFAPPADCPGPCAKVIFTGDFSIQAGVQFDRTGQVFFGNVNIYFDTTAGPLQNVPDTWHVARSYRLHFALQRTANGLREPGQHRWRRHPPVSLSAPTAGKAANKPMSTTTPSATATAASCRQPNNILNKVTDGQGCHRF